jgi:hypothetical protein
MSSLRFNDTVVIKVHFSCGDPNSVVTHVQYDRDKKRENNLLRRCA